MTAPASYNIDLQTCQLYCERDDRVLFEGLDLQLNNGELLQLVGPNGAGKTSLLRLLAGLNRDFSGEVRWQGNHLADVYSEYAQQRLYMGHLSAVKKALSPLENLRWLTAAWQLPDDDLWQALDEVQLYGYEQTPCQQLSAGQQRRVGLARLALAEKGVGPMPLWILDEPFTALDKAGVAWLEGRLQQHVESQGSVLITSHHALENIASLRQLELGRI